MTATEMRKVRRFDLELPGYIRVANEQEGAAVELISSDVCSGGARFLTRQSMPVGTEVEIGLLLPERQLGEVDTGKVLLEVGGSVIRSDSKSMAVRFGETYQVIPFKRCGAALLDRPEEFEATEDPDRTRRIPWSIGARPPLTQRVSAA